jgi:hypothetical protein
LESDQPEPEDTFIVSIHTSIKSTLRLALLGTLVTAAPLLAADIAPDATPAPAAQDQFAQPDHNHTAPATLVRIVQDVTAPFQTRPPAGYDQLLGCISGPEQGAMGVHFVNFALVNDPQILERQPEALMYEVTKGGHMRLLGVEYIVDAATWLAAHDNQPPVLEGQSFQYVGAPNRYALDPFFELHVWAWRENPNGAFVDYNTRVSCEGL